MTRVQYCLDAAKGLGYLHAKHCIHRDVAARNCLVGDNQVKISDFGLCREESQYMVSPSKKVPIRWLAPETLSQGLYTFKSDVFSFGVLMWEVFTDAQEPYPGMKVVDVQSKVKKGYRMDPPAKMPEDLRLVLQETWSAEAAKRPGFSTIAESLKQVIYMSEISSLLLCCTTGL